jgi:hypothetical protein
MNIAIKKNELSMSEEVEIFSALENRHDDPVSLALFEEGVAFAEALNAFGVEHLRLLPDMALIIQSVFIPRVSGVEMLPLRRCFDRIKDELSGTNRKIVDKSEVNNAYRSLSVPFFAFMRRREETGKHGKRTDSSVRVKYGKNGAKVNHGWRIGQKSISDTEKKLAARATEWCRRIALEVLRRPSLVCTMKGSELDLVYNLGQEHLPEWFIDIQADVANLIKPVDEGARPDKAGALVLVKDHAILELKRRNKVKQ